MAEYTPQPWQKNGPGYQTNDYLFADDINKIIYLLNSFIIYDENKFKGIKMPKDGLTLLGPDGVTEWKLTINEKGILQTESSENA